MSETELLEELRKLNEKMDLVLSKNPSYETTKPVPSNEKLSEKEVMRLIHKRRKKAFNQ